MSARAAIRPALAALAAVLLVASPSAGPDLGFYLDWARAATTADIEALHGRVLSPLGVPLSQWAPGPGLLFAVGQELSGWLGDERHAALATGSVAALVFWYGLFVALGRAAEGRTSIVLFGAGAAFAGTHAGFYSHAHASESLAYGAGGLMIAALTAADWGPSRAFHVGVTAALVVLARPQLAPYAVGAVALAMARSWRGGPSRHGAVLAAAPGIVSALVAVTVNRWMTGSPARSPYAFSGQGFASLDWRHPELAAVLAHPFHGLLAYHPLYALGAVALAVSVVRAPSREERALWLTAAAAVTAHLYLQAAWYVWWMGTLSFGMRGLAFAALVVVPALARAVATAGRRERAAWCAATLVCCAWSGLLLFEKHGPVTTWASLLAGQARELRTLSHPDLAGSLLAGLLLASACAWAWSRDGGRDEGWIVASTVFTGAIAMGYLVFRAQGRWLRRGAPEELRVVILVALLALLAAVPIALVAWGRKVRGNDAVREGLGWSATAALAGAGLLFVPLARSTERRIAAGERPPRPMAYVAAVELDQVREAYAEYLELPGFVEKKAALRAFLEAHGVTP